MDYTTLALVKTDLVIKENTSDTQIGNKIKQASRFIDRYLTGRIDAVDYLKFETVSAETLTSPRNPLVDNDGHLICWPHKPYIESVSACSCRWSPLQPWQSINMGLITTDEVGVEIWGRFERERLQVQLTYTGGLGLDTDSLPADLVELATIMAARFYKEAQSGLADVIGVADLGMIQYVKALPVRVQDTLERLKRKLPW